MSVESKDITVVIQGAVSLARYRHRRVGITQACIDAIRRLLPNSTIIVSTWVGQGSGLTGYDRLILTADPGAQSPGARIPNNVNRQITSTLAGIRAADTRYCLKIRTDIVLKSTAFIGHFEREAASETPTAYRLFRARIVANNLTSRVPEKYMANHFGWKLLFHLSDHVHFGYTEDLNMLWDIPLQTEVDAGYFLDNSHPEQFRLEEHSRFAPEQYIALSWLRQYAGAEMKHYADWSPRAEMLSTLYLLNNFLFLRDAQFAFDFPKYHSRAEFQFEGIRYQCDARPPVGDEVPESPVALDAVFSLVIPVCRAMPCLRELVESIFQQSYPHYEVIISQNGCCDDDDEHYFDALADRPEFIVLRNSEPGANLARQRGVAAATGDYVYIIDADDVLSPNALELLADNIRQHRPDVVVVGYSVFKVSPSGERTTLLHQAPKASSLSLLAYRSGARREVLGTVADYNHTFWCYVFRREIIAAAYFNTDVTYFEELETLTDCLSRSRWVSLLPACIYHYRVGTEYQLTAGWGEINREAKIGDMVHIIRRCCQRVRHEPPDIQGYFLTKALRIGYAEIAISERHCPHHRRALFYRVRSAFDEVSVVGSISVVRARFLLLLALMKFGPRGFFLPVTRAWSWFSFEARRCGRWIRRRGFL